MKTLITTLLFTTIAVAGDVGNYNVVWDSPSRDSLGSMPIGNGDIAANVWVEPSGDLVLLLSKTDAYDEFNRLLKLGRVRIKATPALSGPPFTQTLQLENGTIEIKSGDTTVAQGCGGAGQQHRRIHGGAICRAPGLVEWILGSELDNRERWWCVHAWSRGSGPGLASCISGAISRTKTTALIAPASPTD